LGLVVKKSEIAANGGYNLSAERYRRIALKFTKWPLVKLKELEDAGDITLGRGQIISKIDINNDPGTYPVYSSSAKGEGEFGQYGKFLFDE
jgi:hypothetical protein